MTIADAVDEVFAGLGDPDGITVRKYATQANDKGPVLVVGDPDGTSFDATEWYLAVALYQPAASPSGPESQELFYANVATIDALLRTMSLQVRFQSRADSANNRLIGLFTVDVPRQDF